MVDYYEYEGKKYPINYAKRDWVHLIVEKCVICGKKHIHGVGDPNGKKGCGDGFRTPHCKGYQDMEDYYVIEL